MRVLLVFLFIISFPAYAQDVHTSQYHDFKVTPVLEELDFSWGMAFLPDGHLLITEKPGQLLLINLETEDKQSIRGLPTIAFEGQGGLLDVLVHPDFENNQVIFLSYSAVGDGGYGTEVVRARLQGTELIDVEQIFAMQPKVKGGRHFGSRLLWGVDGKLYITLGDRGERHEAQDPSNHIGTTIRINEDGSVPEDNPFVGHETYRPEIFTYGNRNVQGIALHPETDAIWTHEHGPRGGDEINILKAGANYGWPEVTYGREYYGLPITDKRSASGMEDPILHWTPSIAPCGMAFYTGSQFEQWHDDIFVGALVKTHLRRVRVDDTGNVIEQEVLLEDLGERIRDVKNGPDGFIYLLTDSHEGKLLRLEPTQ